MSALGRLVASIVLDSAGFEAGTTRSSYLAAQAADSVERSFRRMENQVKGILSSLGIGLSVGYFVHLIKGSIDAADHLHDLSKTTGIAVETLSGLAVASKQSGGDLDSVAGSINKLAVNMGKDAEKFKALGISAKDPLEAFKQLADIYVKLEDPQQRAAVMAAALGKSWAGAAPLLAEGGKKIGELVAKGAELSGVTTEMAKQADALNDKWVLLVGTGGLLTRMVGPLLPLLNTLADNMLKAQESSKGLGESFSPLLEVMKVLIVLGSDVSFVFTTIGKDIARAMENVKLIAKGDFAGSRALGAAFKKDAEDARVALDAFQKSIMAMGTTSATATPKVAGLTDEQKKAAAAAAAAAKSFLAGSEAVKAAEEALKLYLKALKAEIEMRQEAAAAWAAHDKVRSDAILAASANIEQIKFETSLLGLSNVERQKAIALRALETSGITKQDAAYEDLVRRMRDAIDTQEAMRVKQQELREEQLNTVSSWNDLADRVISGITDWRSALKSFGQELAALFLKKFFLQIVGGLVGGSTGSAIAASGASAGANSLAGSVLSAGGSYLGNTALGTGILQSAPAQFYGGFTGAIQGPGLTGAAGAGSSASAAMPAMSTVLWVAAIVAAMYANNELFTAGWRRPDDDRDYDPLRAVQQGGPLMGASYSADAIFRSLGFSDRMASMFSGSSMNTRLFGHQQTRADAAGITGTVTGAGGFDAAAWQDYSQRGGVFSSDIRWRGGPGGANAPTPLTADQAAPWAEAFTAIHKQMVNLGTMIGVDASELLKNYTKEFTLQLTSTSGQQEVDDAIAAFVRGVFVDQALIVLGAATGQIKAYIDAFHGTTEELVTAMGSVVTIFGVAGRSPLTDAAEVIAAAGNQFQLTLQANAAALRSVGDAYTGNLATTQALASASVDYYNAQVSLIAGITQVKQSIDDMFGATFRNIELAGLDKQGQYDFYQAEAAALQQQALLATDPATIQALAGRINADIAAAFALLSPEEQRARGGEFLTQGRTAQQEIDARLLQIQERAAAQTQETLESIRALIGAGAAAQTEAANTQVVASTNQLAASREPRVIVFEIPSTGQQVTSFG